MTILAIYPGRFHPPHKGHAASFFQLADKFGIENTFFAISKKQELPKSPFSVGDRAKLAILLGIPKENIIAVNSPYGPSEYTEFAKKKNLDPSKVQLVFAVSKKDMEGDPSKGIPPDRRFTFEPKKDGSPTYMQPYSDSMKSMTQHAYIYSTDVEEFPINGKISVDASYIRSAYMKGSPEVKNRILTDIYGDRKKYASPIFDQSLNLTKSLAECIIQIKQLLPECSSDQRSRLKSILESNKKSIDYLEEK